jgi:competence protein ComEC
VGRKASIYNSLAASAFVLLCYNPYFLWDVGFQLSYLALLGIVIFQKPIYHLLYVKNKMINNVWQLMSVTLAAQILTFPICLYYFHQFPTVFLLTNIILVPLSTVILFVEIFLIAFSWIPIAGTHIGKLTWWLIWLMNKIILWFNNLPYALWDRISSSLVTTLILYGFVLCAGFWLLNKSKVAFRWSLFMLAAFAFLTADTTWQTSQQQKMIVYNVPQHQSIDFIDGNTYKFIGDPAMQQEGMLQNFHLKPGRIALQLNRNSDSLSSLHEKNNFFQFNNKKILLIDEPVVFAPSEQKVNVDYIIISKNPKLYIAQLQEAFNCDQYIFDGSNSLWKIAQWKKDCEKLHLRSYSVPEEGAFVLDL